jgi:thiamine biosynthesis protein ThiS
MSKAQVAHGARESVFYVNGSEIEGAPMTLESLLARYDVSLASQGVAVAINERVVPRHTWAECGICAQDRIEIVRAFQGG